MLPQILKDLCKKFGNNAYLGLIDFRFKKGKINVSNALNEEKDI